MEPKKNFKIVPPRNPRVLLPNIFTLVGVCIGLTSIKFAFDGRFEMAVIAIIVAGIIDGLDGRIARLIGGASKVGKELDSLTDVISFGVAPAFIMYFFVMKDLGRIGWLISLIYVVCVALRLARFNISSNTDPSLNVMCQPCFEVPDLGFGDATILLTEANASVNRSVDLSLLAVIEVVLTTTKGTSLS